MAADGDCINQLVPFISRQLSKERKWNEESENNKIKVAVNAKQKMNEGCVKWLFLLLWYFLCVGIQNTVPNPY